ncbi:response regulator, partial [Actinospica sp. MGRD01-02]
ARATSATSGASGSGAVAPTSARGAAGPGVISASARGTAGPGVDSVSTHGPADSGPARDVPGSCSMRARGPAGSDPAREALGSSPVRAHSPGNHGSAHERSALDVAGSGSAPGETGTASPAVPDRFAAGEVAACAVPQTVLLVEDDPGIADPLTRGLERAGFAVRSAVTGSQALAAEPADVVLLDLGLPDADGLDICRRLAARGTSAILVVSARGEECDRVAALDEGADDYLVKPFGLAELLARIRAVLRRINPPDTDSGVVRHGPLVVDSRARKVTVHGEDIPLTPREFEILECLADDPGRVFTRQELLERVWDTNWYGPTKVLDVHVAALRRKLAVPGLIETAYGRG